MLRNVIGKPLRSLIIILSLAAAAFAALYCIAGIHSAQNGLRDFYSSAFGDTDIIVSRQKGNVLVEEKDLPSGSSALRESFTMISFTIPNSTYPHYVSQLSTAVIGVDTKQAHAMGMLEQVYPNEDGITITAPLASQFEKKVGDSLTFYNSKGKEFTCRILAIAPTRKILSAQPTAIVTTPALCNEIGGNPEDAVALMYLDVPENQIGETISSLQEKYPDHSIDASSANDNDDSMNSMLNVYYLIFAVVFLMVCFIVVSLSKHIVNERMSVIGMLRSVGGSVRSTGRLLLAESAFYGLCGGVLGVLLFLPLRGNTEIGLFTPSSDIVVERSDGINFFVILAVILAVILVQCLFSLAAILKAARTPVRDIIFGTKETAYRPSKLLAVTGVILLLLGIGAFCFLDDFLMTILAAFCSAIGAVLFFPMLLRWVCSGLASLFGKGKMPTAKLAAKEVASTKSAVSSSQLILSAMSLTIAVLVLAVSIINLMQYRYFSAQVLITSPSRPAATYEFLKENMEGVEDVELVYYKYLLYDQKGTLNGTERDMMVMGYPDGGFRYLHGIDQLPEKLGEDEAVLDEALAAKLSVHVGDEITLGLNPDKYLPTEKTLKVTALVDASRFNSMGNTVMMNLNTYQKIYFDVPASVLIKTKPGQELTVLSSLKATSPDPPTSIMLTDQYMEDLAASMESILAIIYAVVILGVSLSLLGTASNLLMGFEQSRRKYAVFYSSSMSKDKLKRLILLETVFTTGLSTLGAMLFGLYFLQIISKALSMMSLKVPLAEPWLYTLLFGAGAFIILLVVVIKPLRMIGKMNIAEEIKTGAD